MDAVLRGLRGAIDRPVGEPCWAVGAAVANRVAAAAPPDWWPSTGAKALSLVSAFLALTIFWRGWIPGHLFLAPCSSSTSLMTLMYVKGKWSTCH